MGSTMYAEERHIASLAVQHASLLTKSVMRSIKHVSKKDSTPVTVADFAVQALLISTLSQAFPADNFLGEESAAALREDAVLCQQVWELVSSSQKSLLQDEKGRTTTALVPPSSPEQMLELIDRGGLGTGGRQGRTWIMDPIDGTATFIEGGQYAVAVALVEDGREVLGVVGCPNLALDLPRLESVPADDDGHGFVASAVRGDHGVLVQPIRPSGELPPGQFIPSRRLSSQPTADLNFVDSVLGEEYQLRQAKKLATGLGCASFPTTEIWSTQVRLVVMALAGRDNMVQVRLPRPYSGGEEDPENYIWDYAGAHVILLESGGVASDLNGKEIDFGTGRRLSGNWGLIAASRPELQARLLGQAREFCAGEAVKG
ncbi:inositol monophosphatase family protein [Cordyceps fumosorosea ARSEF 2679]|uniref:Inositol monophosphatase family protein n=1 Tax=Cordyceps fumosorosea (strain ARSEF 2679) TaxID=1081104 RepID=A0A167MX21_CORFA|nr:inositol monophosphatase family protein [Cordyceps fumosorosea ARSEF 2679]OAA54854.1 inositol monophosphatase family protein [Cordyceps fumosorosea ARSEF 2679]